jgi:hypothetical protein
MKNKNEENINKGLTAVLSLLLPLLTISCQRAPHESLSGSILTFEGVIEKLAPDQGILSGRVAVFRLVRYRVEKICKGNYAGKLIVVDHLILSGKEFEGINLGNRVCVSVRSSDKMPTRYDAEGIRNPSDVVPMFFVAEEIKPLSDGAHCCDI